MSLLSGTYAIQSQESSPRGVVCPDTSLLDQSLVLQVPNVKSVAQLWNITSDGSIASTAYPDKYVSVNTDSGNIDGTGALVIISAIVSAIRIFWVFSLPGSADEPGIFSRCIYTTYGGQKYYWGCEATSNNIQLTTEEYYWTFTSAPVSGS